jgi:hypothetical protein
MESVWLWYGSRMAVRGVNQTRRIVRRSLAMGATNFRRKFGYSGGFPGVTLESGELGLFGENSSLRPANSLAGTPAPA